MGCGKRHAEGVGTFKGTLTTKLALLPLRDLPTKGDVERRNG